MTQWQSLAPAIRFQRTVWNNALSMCSALQLSGKDMLANSLDQCPWLTEHEKQGYLSWAGECIQATENLKSLIDSNLQEVERHLSDPPPAAPGADEKRASPAAKDRTSVPAAAKATASPAKKKAAPGRSSAQSKSTRGEPLKKTAVTRQKPAASETKSDPASGEVMVGAPRRRAKK